ncbi:hypothetical protein BAUCODRAFT_29639 [Baudoinia panamericana UAMH 10762]|uniref:Uncharacterized protein n=1 Tax=Baudoinia panamericana (strain UAMH 10762) TaxID=717646 RepID=M2NQ82_BAUPA|nr:uncharacterized protein BAUCODRAFT_29639 [Baudoinia panamericana UAMH 10762]EMD01196.1 hypothetical protein BAUCODRAFT_29639 [Baudoinia panamericana UAMH 10762]
MFSPFPCSLASAILLLPCVFASAIGDAGILGARLVLGITTEPCCECGECETEPNQALVVETVSVCRATSSFTPYSSSGSTFYISSCTPSTVYYTQPTWHTQNVTATITQYSNETILYPTLAVSTALTTVSGSAQIKTSTATVTASYYGTSTIVTTLTVTSTPPYLTTTAITTQTATITAVVSALSTMTATSTQTVIITTTPPAVTSTATATTIVVATQTATDLTTYLSTETVTSTQTSTQLQTYTSSILSTTTTTSTATVTVTNTPAAITTTAIVTETETTVPSAFLTQTATSDIYSTGTATDTQTMTTTLIDTVTATTQLAASTLPLTIIYTSSVPASTVISTFISTNNIYATSTIIQISTVTDLVTVTNTVSMTSVSTATVTQATCSTASTSSSSSISTAWPSPTACVAAAPPYGMGQWYITSDYAVGSCLTFVGGASGLDGEQVVMAIDTSGNSGTDCAPFQSVGNGQIATLNTPHTAYDFYSDQPSDEAGDGPITFHSATYNWPYSTYSVPLQFCLQPDNSFEVTSLNNWETEVMLCQDVVYLYSAGNIPGAGCVPITLQYSTYPP